MQQKSGWTGSGRKTRRAPPKHVEWIPHAYQEKASDHLVDRPVAALFLDPGLGKTSITLDAFCRLVEARMAKKMLVIAPKRVCQLVWQQEAEQWTQFKHLRFSKILGTPKQKEKALAEDADIYLINPEGIAWLAKQYEGRPHRFPFDTVTIDELTKFKNARSQRSKLLRPLLKKVARKWGLTGTPIPNGYMDLFGQILVLDGGRALGTYITHYRNQYFQQGYTGFDWILRSGAAERIEEKIKPYVLRMSADDYLDLPEMIPDVREIVLEPKARKLYQDLKREMLVETEDGDTITADNAGGVYSKLKQMANGAVYVGEGRKRKYVHLHDQKLDELADLVDELQGAQLLVGYEFKHDLERLKKRFPNAAVLGSGVSDKEANRIEREWNSGEIDLLFAHPASAGHGLNFQKSSAGHVCWFSTTIDLELYDQFLARVRRQGNKNQRVINHALVVRGTVDAMSIDTIEGKALTQERFLQALKDELSDQGDDDMPLKRKGRVSRKSEVEETEESGAKTKGWGKKASDDDEDEEEEDGEEEQKPRRRRSRARQADSVKSRLEGEDDEDEEEDEDDEEEEEKPRRRRGFSKSVKDRLEEEDGEDEEEEDGEDEEDEEPEEAPKPKRTRRSRAKPKADPEPEEDEGEDDGEEEDEPPFEGGQPVGCVPSPEEEAFYRRVRALELSAQFAERLSLKTASEAVKAAEVFYDYLTGSKK
jgi:hypothetical protein